MPRHSAGLGATGFPAANKLLMRYEADRAYKLHMQKLHNTRHRLDVKEPKKQNHLILRLKQIQKEEERQAEIDHENKLLLNKMTHVMKYGGNIDNWNNYESRSLNYPFRERQNEQIARENIGIARRLESVRPKVRMDAWDRDFRKHQYLKRLWNDSVKDYGEFTPRHLSRMSRAVKRSMDSLDETFDDDYSIHTDTDDRKLPQLDKSKKYGNSRKTKSETNAPTSSRKEEPKPAGGRGAPTKLPKIIPHRNEDEGKSQEAAVSVYRAKDSVRLFEKIYNPTEYWNKHDKKRPQQKKKDKSKANCNSERNKESHDKGKKGSEEGEMHTQSRSSFQSANASLINDLERVKTLISMEKDADQGEADQGGAEPKRPGTPTNENVDEDNLKTVESEKEEKDTTRGSDDRDIGDSLGRTDTVEQTNKTEDHSEDDKENGASRKTSEVDSLPNDVEQSEDKNESGNLEGHQKESAAGQSDCKESSENETSVRKVSDSTNNESIDSEASDGNVKKRSVTRHKPHKEDSIDKASTKSGEKAVSSRKSVNAIRHDSESSKENAEDGGGTNNTNKSVGNDLPSDNVKKKVSSQKDDKKSHTKNKRRTQSDSDAEKKTGEKERHKKTSETNSRKKSESQTETVTKEQKEDGASGAGKQQQESSDDKSDVAQLFKIAKQMGKPEDIFIKTLIKKSHKQRMATKAKFRQKYDLDLISELKQGLGGKWEYLITALLQEHGVADAYDIFDALSGSSAKTADIPDVVELLVSRNNAAIADLKESYRKEFNTSLEEDILDRTKPPQQTLLLALQKGCRDESAEVDENEAKADARDLMEAGEDRWESEGGQFLTLVSERSIPHVCAVFSAYKSMSGGSILQDVKDECPKEYYQAINTLVQVMEVPANYFADQIHRHRLPTDPLLINILVGRSEIDMPAIRKVYKKSYGIDITEELKSKHHPTQKCLIELASKVPGGAPKKGADGKKVYSKGGPGSISSQQTGGSKSQPAPPAAKKQPAKKTELSKAKGDDVSNPDGQTSGPAVASKSKQQEQQPKPQDAATQQSKKKDNHDKTVAPNQAKPQQKDAGSSQPPGKRKRDGDHCGTVKPVANFNPDQDVEKLNSAMSGIGTDEQVIVSIIPKRSNLQRQELKKVYEQKYKKNLMIDLESELTGDMEEIVLAMMMSPSEYDAYVLHEAVEGLGSSEATLIGTLCTRQPEDMTEIREHYKKAYKTNMELDISRDTAGTFQGLLMELAKGGRQSGVAVNMNEAQRDAKDLYQEDQPFDPASATFKALITKKSHVQVQAAFDEYKRLAGYDIYTGITKAALGEDEEGYISLAKAAGDPALFYSEKLNACFNQMGTNDNLLIRIVISRSEIDLMDIKSRYSELYTHSLYDDVNRECRGDYKTILLTVIENPETADGTTSKKKPGVAAAKKTKPTGGQKDKPKPAVVSPGASVKPTQPFNAVEDSERLHAAMDGLGTDEAVIHDILPKRSNAQRQEIKAKYQDKYAENLQEQLESELSGDYEEIVLAMMMKPIEYDAYCLHDAISGLGTREVTLISIMSTRTSKSDLGSYCPFGHVVSLLAEMALILKYTNTNKELAAIKARYKEVYGKDLEDAVMSDVSGGLEIMLHKLLKCQRDQGLDVNIAEAKEDAKKLQKIEISDKDECLSILAEKSRAQVKATLEEYKKLNGYDIYRGFEMCLGEEFQMAYRYLAQAIEDPIQFYTERLHDCFFDGGSINDKQLIRLVVSRSEIDLEDIKKRFKTAYNTSLSRMIQMHIAGDYSKTLLNIVGRDK